MNQESLKEAARMLYKAKNIVVFTGAGISTESGIPDFRSPGGVWTRYDQKDLTYQKFRSHEKYRKLYWEYDRARYPAMKDATPNAAHLAIVELERLGKLRALITQNIDGLHIKAGNSQEKILEIHGTVHRVTCLDCEASWPREEITDEMDRTGVEVPYCASCGGPLKCATIAFGQSLPGEIITQAFQHARKSDLFLTIGSSLVVQPACFLPMDAKSTGAQLILVNRDPTPYDAYMDVVLRGEAGRVMEELMTTYRTVAGPKPD